MLLLVLLFMVTVTVNYTCNNTDIYVLTHVQVDEAHRLMLLLAIQRELGEKSNWGCYIDALPAEYDTLMFWSDKQLQELAGEFATHLVRCAYLHSVAQ